LTGNYLLTTDALNHVYQPETGGNLLLKQLPNTFFRRLVPHMKKVVLTVGEYMVRPDETVEWIYFPETAAISELQILEDGRTIEVALIGPESAVGIAHIGGPSQSLNWVQTSVSGTALKVRADALRAELLSAPFMQTVFHQALQNYIKQMSQKVACNAHHSVQERFSTWLLMLQDRCTAQKLRLTQEQIARVLGVYRPSVTCIAQNLRDTGLIDYVRGSIIIRDRTELRKLACSCYSETSTAVRTAPALNVPAAANRAVM
jgi:CRP-like cAMP-binding protein